MTRYAHTNIVTKDWRSLSTFYIEVFDCRPVPPTRDLAGDWLDQATGLRNAHLKGQHLRLPGFGEHGPTLEIFQYDEMLERSVPSAANRLGLGHLAFEVDQVEETLKVLLANGGHKIGEVVKQEIAGVGVITFTYASDPEGNLLEIQSWEYF